MSLRDERYESMLLNYETTGRTEYRKGAIEPITKTKYQGKSTCLRIRPPPLKDLHALTNWKTPNVPFNLLHRPKDIVQTDPWKSQKPYYQPVDLLRKEAQMTRPRLIMTPAVCVDDLDDSKRGMLIEEVYTTALARAQRESGVRIGRNVCAPLPRAQASSNPIILEKLQPSAVPAEWRMDSVSWDNRQLRSHCEATRRFWLGSTLPEYAPIFVTEQCRLTRTADACKAVPIPDGQQSPQPMDAYKGAERAMKLMLLRRTEEGFGNSASRELIEAMQIVT